MSVALGGRFEKSASPNSLSIFTSSGETSWLVLNGLRSKGLRPAREGGGVEYSSGRLGVAVDAALEDEGCPGKFPRTARTPSDKVAAPELR